MPILSSNWFDLLEGLLVAGALAGARFGLRGGTSFARGEAWLKRFAENKTRAIFASALLPMALRLVLMPVMPIPAPAIHDEFSHLLVADTLAHGRLANPPNPHWEFFETFHVLHHPTYASMEPPGPGLFLAMGQKLLGDPWFGVWLGMGLFCGALCWALQQWVSPGWALAGAIMAGLRWGVLSYWMNSYWGGTAAALGGALVFGAAAALVRKPAVRPSILLGIGWSLMAASRPLEGMLASIPVAIYLAGSFFRSRQRWDVSIKGAAPAVLTLGLGVSALMAYNTAVTGHPLRMPNQVNRQEYASLPYFVWEKAQPGRTYRHEVMRRFYDDFELAWAESARAHPVHRHVRELGSYFIFYIGFVLLIPLGVGVWSRRQALGVGMLAAAVALPWISQAVTNTGLLAHYHAPVLTALIILMVMGFQELRARGEAGVLQSRALALVCAGMFLLALPLQLAGVLPRNPPNYSWYAKSIENLPRAAIVESLRSTGGQHLIFVSYAPNHQTVAEWVFNDADLPGARVVWARDMGDAKNAELIGALPGRTVWRLEPDRPGAELVPYNERPLLP